ncbi:MAG: hypothetical protein H6708_14565 [Kofleriaceae bacterium]|nr:hypothetical protein [Kofleriaceae bacterium]
MAASTAYHWDIVEDHWIDLEVSDAGLGYVGTDWTCLSGGGYTAGFQTLDGFLRDGPLPRVHMPAEVADQVRADVEARLAGARPSLAVTVTVAPGVRLAHASIELDGRPVLVRDFAEPPARLEVSSGTTSAGSHRIGWALLAFDAAGARARLYGDTEVEAAGAEAVAVDVVVAPGDAGLAATAIVSRAG